MEGQVDGAAQSSRHTCPTCGKRKGAYCEDCVVVLEQPAPPQLRLPVKIDIVQHGETNARSTALHAALLAAADVALHRHADSKTSRRCDPLDLQLPDFDAATTVVLFPEGPQTEVVGQCPPFERVVVLESTWKKVRSLLRHPKLAGLRRVQLPPQACTTEFTWRRGDGSFRGAVDEGLSSIEAIHQCCRLLGDTEESYVGLLHYFLRTKQLMEKRGPLPTSRQDARARQRQKQEQEQEAPQAQAQQQQAGAAAGSVAAPEEQQERQQEGQQELQQERQQEQQQLVGKGLVADVPSDQQQQAALAGGGQGLLPDSPSHNRKATSV